MPVSLSGLRVTGGAEIPNVSGGCGIYAFAGDLQVDNFSVVGNQGATGGGIMGTKRLRLSNGTIERNVASEAGGGLYWSAEAPSSIQNVYIANNSAVTAGGVYYTGSQLTIAGCEISENIAIKKGGGIFEYSGTLVLDAATRIVENRAPQGGGGVWNDAGTLQRNDADISANSPDNCRGSGCQ